MQLELFAQATKSRLRFKSSNGVLSTEDLWCLTLESLNDIAVVLHTELQSKQVSFISTEAVDKTTELKLNVVKYIIQAKLDELESRKQAQEKLAKKQRLLELKHQRESEKFAQLSEEEIDKQLKELE